MLLISMHFTHQNDIPYMFIGREDDKYTGIDFVEKYELFVVQDWFFYGTVPFDRVYLNLVRIIDKM